MKPLKTGAILFISLTILGLGALGISRFKSTTRELTSPAGSIKLSKADERILRATQLIERDPHQANGYNQLASAYMQKARETAEFDLNENADEAINRSLSVEPDNYDALKLRAKLQLTYHRFAPALATARQAQRVRMDDQDVWGLITDALVELGDYPNAVKSAQKMVDLRPDSSSYARVAYLRSLHGDTYGAIQAMSAALKAADPNDPEGVAWCHVHLGNELMNAGKLDAAESQFDEALRTLAGYRLASQAKARARVAAGDLQAAVRIYEREPAKNASADAAQALGDLYAILGQDGVAKDKYKQFEVLERENVALEKSWRHMLNYWLDHDQNVADALTLATQEYAERKDIFTCDTLAWALFKNGRAKEAKRFVDEALRTRSKDARINYHAGIIFKALNLRQEAVQHLKFGGALGSSFDLIQHQAAKKMLAEF
jgi:tetratricopeptide (TPR) repeat protein